MLRRRHAASAGPGELGMARQGDSKVLLAKQYLSHLVVVRAVSVIKLSTELGYRENRCPDLLAGQTHLTRVCNAIAFKYFTCYFSSPLFASNLQPFDRQRPAHARARQHSRSPSTESRPAPRTVRPRLASPPWRPPSSAARSACCPRRRRATRASSRPWTRRSTRSRSKTVSAARGRATSGAEACGGGRGLLSLVGARHAAARGANRL